MGQIVSCIRGLGSASGKLERTAKATLTSMEAKMIDFCEVDESLLKFATGPTAATSTPLINLDAQNDFHGVLRHVDSIECIYVASGNQVATVERLSDCFHGIFKTSPKIQSCIESRDSVILKNDQGYFVRAEEYGTSGGLLQVYLTDFGDELLVEFTECAKLPKAHYELEPPQVFKLKLHLLYGKALLDKHKRVLDEKLLQLLKKGDKVSVQFLQNNFEKCPEVVISKVDNFGAEIVVNDILLEQLKPTPELCDTIQSTTLCRIADVYEEENVVKAISGYEPKDEIRTCRVFQRTGSCDRKNCTKEHVKLDPDGWTYDREAIYCKPYNFLDLDISPGSHLIILVTSTVNSCTSRFFGQILNLPSEHGTLDELNHLICQLADSSRLNIFEILPALGQLVVARCGTEFYRARVVDFIDENSSSKVLVFCVDYGFTKEVELHNVWKILPSLLHLPFQVVQFFCDSKQPVLFNLHPGSRIQASCIRVDSELNVEIKLQGSF